MAKIAHVDEAGQVLRRFQVHDPKYNSATGAVNLKMTNNNGQ